MQSLASLLRDRWAIDVTSATLLQEANGRRITQVHAAQGIFVAKELPASADLVGLAALDLLNRQGFPHAPRLVPTTDGATHVVRDRAIYVMGAIDGDRPSAETGIQHELGGIARAVNEVSGFQQARAQSVAAVIADLLQRDEGLQLGPSYRRLVSGLEVLVNRPLALVHGEINAANALMTATGNIVLLDWDDAGLGVRWLDAGYPLIQTYLSEDLTFDVVGAQAFYRGYTAGLGFTDDEWDLVFAAATLHALRYLPWGDTAARWRRLLHADEAKADLMTSVAGRDD